VTDLNPAIEQLVKLTANLAIPGAAALTRASQLTGDSRTDTLNRALIAYGHLVDPDVNRIEVDGRVWRRAAR